jgi:photosystem II stability/assembly factor-like uncharacterized protein
MASKRRSSKSPKATYEDRPHERATVHRRARRQGDAKGNQAALRVEALAHSRPAVLTPAPSPAVPGASNWVPLGPSAIPNGQTYGGVRVLVSGRVTGIALDPLDPSTIYLAAARGGIWKSEDGGITWTPKSDNEVSLAIGALALAPSAPNVLYAGTGEGNIHYFRVENDLTSVNESYEGSGVLKSMDGGDTWSVLGAAEFGGGCFYALAVHPTDPNVVFAATNRGLYRSRDGGAAWAQLTNGLPAISPAVFGAACDVVIDPASPETAYAAFWGKGVYRTTGAGAANPSFSAIGGIPAATTRISLAIAPSSPQTVYAAAASGTDELVHLYRTAGGPVPSFDAISLGGAASQVSGPYTGEIAVDISTPDVVYVSGISLYKAVRDPLTDTWALSDVGGGFHPDNHALAMHPTDHQRLYAGSDGGIYRSDDGGASWHDSINSGLSLTQFEFTDHHPTSDAVVFGGTQDNGTEQFRNSPVFHHAADGDGGAVVVDQSNPNNVVHTYYTYSGYFGLGPVRSVQGGEFGTDTQAAYAGLAGSSLFYPPMVADATDSRNLAFGTDRLCLDSSGGVGGWPVAITLPGIAGRVSAIAYVNSDLIYAGTTSGKVYRAARAGTAWTATQIGASPLPARWIWDLAAPPDDGDTVVVVMSGFGTAHVHRGSVAAGGASATWADISGNAPNRLPDVPVNSLQVDPSAAATMYIGSDVGVFRTVDGGANWTPYNNGLPNTAVYDLRLHAPSRLLRAATHGRGLWERPVDAVSTPNVELFVRNHPMDTARNAPPSDAVAAFADPLQGVQRGDYLAWWMCADAKIDSPEGTPPSYQMPVAAVDYVAFESALAHRSVKRGRVNRVYVQVHNRGIATAEDTVVKALVADAGAGVPDLPADFWARFPADSLDPASKWTAVGPAWTVPRVPATQPAVVEWDWTPPLSAAEHLCMLIVVDSAADPIPTAHKVTSVAQLVTSERRVGQRNLHVVDAPPGPSPVLAEMLLTVFGRLDRFELVMPRAGWSLGLLLPARAAEGLSGDGFAHEDIDAKLRDALERRRKEWEESGRGRKEPVFAEPAFVRFTRSRAVLGRLPISKRGFAAFLVATSRGRGGEAMVTLVQESKKAVVGGNTYVLRPRRR